MSIRSHLAALENAGLIQLAAGSSELAYIFRHGLIQDAAYTTLLRQQRQIWHQAVGEALESVYQAGGGQGREELVPVLAHHFAIAGDQARAVSYFRLAADAAFERYANTEAAEFYGQALAVLTGDGECGHDPDLILHLFSRRGRALELNNNYRGALQHYAEMADRAQRCGDGALELAALTARATVLSTANPTFDPAQSQAVLERAVALAQRQGDRAAEAKINWNLMLLNAMRGDDVDERRRYGEQALALARELNLREQIAFILADLWYAYAGAGHWAEGLKALDEAVGLWREVGNLTMLGETVARQSLIYQVWGDYDKAIALAEETDRLAQAANSLEIQALSRSFVGLIFFDRGEIDRAMAVMEKAIALGERTGSITVRLATSPLLGWTYGVLGDTERGLALVRKTLAGPSTHFIGFETGTRAVLARLHLLRGETAAAEAVLADLGDYRACRRRAGFIPFAWSQLALANVEVRLARGTHDEAVKLLDDILAELRAEGLRFLLPEVLYLRGQALLAQGRLALARAALREAQTEALALDARRILWPTLAALAEVEARAGLPEAAADLRRQARKLASAIAARISDTALRAAFLDRPEIHALAVP